MMKVYCPSNGKNKEVDISRISGKKFFWCNCENPSYFDLKKISNKTKIDIDDLKRYKNHKNAKIIFKKNYDIVILKYPFYQANKIILKNLIIIFNKKFIISLCDSKIETIDYFTKHIIDELAGVKKADYIYFLHRLLGALSKQFFLLLDKIELRLEKIENQIIKARANIKNLFFVKKNLLVVRKALVSNRNVLVDLQQGSSKFLVPDMITSVYSEFERVLNTEELLRDRLTSSLNIHLSFSSNKMNDIMKSFTVIASLLLIPMLISSIYGMNIKLPIQDHPNAFYSIMLFVFLSVMLTVIYFKRKRWV